MAKGINALPITTKLASNAKISKFWNALITNQNVLWLNVTMNFLLLKLRDDTLDQYFGRGGGV